MPVDNVTANAGSGGPVFATDYTGAEHWPISKVGFGTRDSQYTLVDSNNPLPTTTKASGSTNGSGVITAGGTAQYLFASAVPVNGYEIFNPDPANDLWVSDFGVATAAGYGSFLVPARGWYRSPVGCAPHSAISILGATTGHAFTARSW